MKKPATLLALCMVVTGCGTSRWGIAYAPIEEADSEAAAREAIQHALAPEEKNCNVELIPASTPDPTPPIVIMEVVIARVCEKKQKFSIQRHRHQSGKVAIIAKRI